MVNRMHVKRFILSSLAIVFLFSMLFINMANADPFSEVKGKLSGILKEQSQVLQKLFLQVQKIEQAENEANSRARDIEKVRTEIEGLQKLIKSEESEYANKKEDLKQVLTVYQRMGPGSYLEILLKSDSLPDLVRRINILRDLTRDTGGLLDEITNIRKKQLEDHAKLSARLSLMEDRQKALQQVIDKEKQAKEELEHTLASLKEKRGQYQQYLDSLQKAWGELKPFFSKAAKDFSDQIQNGGFPPDSVKITFGLFGIKASIEDKTINDIIAKDPRFNHMTFRFTPDKVEITIPDKNLNLKGKFVISEKACIKFEAEEGSFFGMPLEAASIKELFNQGDLMLDFSSQLGDGSLGSLVINEGSLDLSVKLNIDRGQ